jgi:hypothetical protein
MGLRFFSLGRRLPQVASLVLAARIFADGTLGAVLGPGIAGIRWVHRHPGFQGCPGGSLLLGDKVLVVILVSIL